MPTKDAERLERTTGQAHADAVLPTIGAVARRAEPQTRLTFARSSFIAPLLGRLLPRRAEYLPPFSNKTERSS
jgi:hypothetical protein